MARPVIALLSDFRTQDHYAGAMKGVALGICPDAILVDITHDIPPHDVRTGALELAAAYPPFPAGTVFLVVADPEVGSTRRAIAVEAGAVTLVTLALVVRRVMVERTPSVESTPAVEES